MLSVYLEGFAGDSLSGADDIRIRELLERTFAATRADILALGSEDPTQYEDFLDALALDLKAQCEASGARCYSPDVVPEGYYRQAIDAYFAEPAEDAN